MHFAAFAPALLLATSITVAAAPNEARSAMNASSACAQATILAKGIALNILDQEQEQAALTRVNAVLAAAPVDAVAFKAAKSQLLTFVQNGIAIRTMNQLIAPPGNGAIAGLAIVANAQLTELGLSSNLTGNPATDNAITAALAKDFAGGIEQNKKNEAAATAGCCAGGAAPRGR